MKKILNLSLGLYFITTGVQAEGLLLESRFDHVNSSYNDAALIAGNKNSNSYQGARLRLLMNSKVNEELSVRLRLNLLSAQDSPKTESKYSKYVDFANIQHQLTPHFYLQAGKVVALIGGREMMTNSMDYYLTSMAGQELLAQTLWPVGVILGTNLQEHKIELLAANTTQDDGNAQSRSMLGISFLGQFLDKSLQPLLSFHSDAEAENTEKRNYVGVGVKYLISDYEFDVDYLSNQKSYKVWTLNSSKELTSFVLSARYKMTPQMHFVLKGDSSVDQVATTVGADPIFEKIKYEQVGLAFEYIPYVETKFRYHIAATQKNTKPVVGDSQVEQKVIVGIKLLHDILK